MPNEAFAWMGRIKAVEREYLAVRFATDYLSTSLISDPTILVANIRRPDIRTAESQLEGTYIIRAFAEFETSLHGFLHHVGVRKRKQAKALIDKVSTHARIPHDMTSSVHRVREYRNVLVHERTKETVPATIREVTSSLCTFLSRVQRLW